MKISLILSHLFHCRIERIVVVAYVCSFLVASCGWSNHENVQFFDSIKQGNLTKAKALIKADPTLTAVKDKSDMTPLHYAARLGNRDLAELLIFNTANINAKDKSGATPLHLAALNTTKVMSGYLLTHGADVNAKDNGDWTPLQLAAANGHMDTVELLLAHGADINTKNKHGMTPLIVAENNGYENMAEFLIQHGGH
jgi:ankyrin repeat protein